MSGIHLPNMSLTLRLLLNRSFYCFSYLYLTDEAKSVFCTERNKIHLQIMVRYCDCMEKKGLKMATALFQLCADDEPSQEVKKQEWQAGFEAMGNDPDVNNVEYMLFAAQEVLFDGENRTNLLD